MTSLRNCLFFGLVLVACWTATVSAAAAVTEMEPADDAAATSGMDPQMDRLHEKLCSEEELSDEQFAQISACRALIPIEKVSRPI